MTSNLDSSLLNLKRLIHSLVLIETKLSHTSFISKPCSEYEFAISFNQSGCLIYVLYTLIFSDSCQRVVVINLSLIRISLNSFDESHFTDQEYVLLSCFSDNISNNHFFQFSF
ncbi:TPA: hypothetical protein DEG21_03825 [Patescibacteria group bacterium]|nr:hypothetical protein [Candidatus Gracilibacteria bacterium]HBY74979.1 hypothetical protein [Candidatus Gracilibacteria bacterium]